MFRLIASIYLFCIFSLSAIAQNQSSVGNCSPNANGSSSKIIIENCIIYKKTDAPDGGLVVNFSRLPVHSNTASIMKLAEGAVFEFAPEWSHGDERKQYWITDGIDRFGLATETMTKIWENHAFKGKMPVATPLWRTISGNTDSIKALSFLAFVSTLKEKYNHRGMAFKYACYESVLLDKFDCFCPREIFERTLENTLGQRNLYKHCSKRDEKLKNIFFTIMNIENKGTRPIKNLELIMRDSSRERVGWITDLAGIFKQCGLEDQLEGQVVDTRKFHNCVHLFLAGLANESSESEQYATLEMSSLPPGEGIFLLMNSFVPDIDGLPGEYIMGHIHVDRINYRENGQVFSILKPTPLADRRIPVITSPDGGRGGQ